MVEPEFKVQHARKYLTDQAHLKNIADEDARATPFVRKERRSPSWRNMYQKKKSTPDDVEATENDAKVRYSDEFWTTVFRRIYHYARHPPERQFLWDFAHGAIWTDGRKSRMRGLGDAPSGGCRRCRLFHPTSPPPFENSLHAFYFCPTVFALWQEVKGWLRTIYPRIPLYDDPVATILGWPDIPDVTRLVLHIHSVTVASIFRDYCKVADKEPVLPDDLRWMVVLSLQRRAKTELVRALLKDAEIVNAPRNQAAPLTEEAKEPYFRAMKNAWNAPPHIVVTKESVTFGDMWPRPPAAQDHNPP